MVLLVPCGPVLAVVSPILLFLMKGVTSQETMVSPLLPPFCFSLGGVWLSSGAALVASCSGSADADLHLVYLRLGSQGLVCCTRLMVLWSMFGPVEAVHGWPFRSLRLCVCVCVWLRCGSHEHSRCVFMRAGVCSCRRKR